MAGTDIKHRYSFADERISIRVNCLRNHDCPAVSGKVRLNIVVSVIGVCRKV